MYIQCTSVCNMLCRHCCFDCGPKGKHMSVKTFETACKLAENLGEHISIGGGEPTCHPEFFRLVGLVIQYSDYDNDQIPWLATNGKNTEAVLKLALLAKNGVLQVRLSQDKFHEQIDERVVKAFTIPRDDYGIEKRSNRDYRETTIINNNYDYIRNSGRAEKNGLGANNLCCCNAMFVSPSGTIWRCGCKTVSWGTVYKPNFPKDIEQYEGNCPKG